MVLWTRSLSRTLWLAVDKPAFGLIHYTCTYNNTQTFRSIQLAFATAFVPFTAYFGGILAEVRAHPQPSIRLLNPDDDFPVSPTHPPTHIPQKHTDLPRGVLALRPAAVHGVELRHLAALRHARPHGTCPSPFSLVGWESR